MNIKHIADLANLKLAPKELKKFQKQLTAVLEYIETLNSVKTGSVEPTSQVTGLENVFRTDETKPSLTQKQALSNASQSKNGFFVIKDITKKWN